MMCVRKVLIVVFLLWGTSCFNESNTVNMKEQAPSNQVQEKGVPFIQPHLNMLKKAKALEGKLKGIEQNRLNTIEDFDK